MTSACYASWGGETTPTSLKVGAGLGENTKPREQDSWSGRQTAPHGPRCHAGRDLDVVPPRVNCAELGGEDNGRCQSSLPCSVGLHVPQ